MRLFFPLLLLGCSNGFGDGGNDPTANGRPHDNDTAGDADTDTDGDTDTDTDSDTDGDADGDTDTDTDTASPADIDDDGDGLTENEGDCDDGDADVNPGRGETPYNGVDDDCDPTSPDDDLDGDGADHTEDCDDGDADVNPERAETPYNGVDDDCDPTSPDDDLDGDGVDAAEDCDDGDDTAAPGAAEVSDDGVDNDCDGTVDEPFEVTTVDATGDAGNPSAIGVDSSGVVHLVYHDDSTGFIRYSARSGAGWSAPVDIVTDDSSGDALDLVVDGADQVQIAYTWASGSYSDLWFGYRDAAGVWDVGYLVDGYSVSATTSTGHFVSIDVDSSNLPSFAYYDDDYLVPRLADFTSFGVGLYTDVDVWWYWTYATGYFTSLAIDQDDYDHVAWFDDNTLGSEAQYADYNEGTANESIAPDAWYTALALQSDDTACVAYADATLGDLVYGCRDAARETWSATTVDSVGNVGSYAQLAFDSADQPWIAYYDVSNGDLKVAAELGGTWQTWTVDSAGDVGMSPSITIDAADQVFISYYDATNGAVKVAIAN